MSRVSSGVAENGRNVALPKTVETRDEHIFPDVNVEIVFPLVPRHRVRVLHHRVRSKSGVIMTKLNFFYVQKNIGYRDETATYCRYGDIKTSVSNTVAIHRTDVSIVFQLFIRDLQRSTFQRWSSACVTGAFDFSASSNSKLTYTSRFHVNLIAPVISSDRH